MRDLRMLRKEHVMLQGVFRASSNPSVWLDRVYWCWGAWSRPRATWPRWRHCSWMMNSVSNEAR
jgi:hypothetical protein